MSMEEAIRRIVREENEKHFGEIKSLLGSLIHKEDEIPRMLKVPEAAKVLRIGLTATYELCQQAEHNGFPCFKEGNRIRIPYHALIDWIDEQVKQVV